jgi:hypothetical protein
LAASPARSPHTSTRTMTAMINSRAGGSRRSELVMLAFTVLSYSTVLSVLPGRLAKTAGVVLWLVGLSLQAWLIATANRGHRTLVQTAH